MFRPDLEQQIITSEEAKAFLQMVTKGFYNQSFTGLWIYEVIGREWDEMRAWAEGLQNEVAPQTCTWSLPIWEWVYGIEPDDSLELEYRRRRILVKIKAIRPINPETIRRAVAVLIGTSVEAVEVTDLVGPYRFEVIIHPQGTPLPYNRIDPYIRSIKPSHLSFETSFIIIPDNTADIFAGTKETARSKRIGTKILYHDESMFTVITTLHSAITCCAVTKRIHAKITHDDN